MGKFLSDDLYVCLAIDIDRDAVVPVKGKIEGVNHFLVGKKKTSRNKVLYDGTIKGLEILMPFLKKKNIQCTLFMEGNFVKHFENEDILDSILFHEVSCHGMDHEDLLGINSGIKLNYSTQKKIIGTATKMIEKIIGKRPLGFRAPYLRLNKDTFHVLVDQKYVYDSSLSISNDVWPDSFKTRIIETPLFPCYIQTENYKITEMPFHLNLYLWQFFEKKKSIDFYEYAINKLFKNRNGGYCMISMHPWHICYSMDEQRYLEEKEIEYNYTSFFQFLEKLANRSFVKFTTISEFLTKTDLPDEVVEIYFCNNHFP